MKKKQGKKCKKCSCLKVLLPPFLLMQREERTHTGTMIKIPLMANQRNDKFNSKGKRRAGDRGRGQPFKKARKSRMY